eukprot:2449130-Prymnesium_polylepis.1
MSSPSPSHLPTTNSSRKRSRSRSQKTLCSSLGGSVATDRVIDRTHRRFVAAQRPFVLDGNAFPLCPVTQVDGQREADADQRARECQHDAPVYQEARVIAHSQSSY